MMNYPYNYYQQPYFQNPMPDQLAQLRQNAIQQPASPTNDERIWVSNKNAADSYLVAPNGFVRLWDSSTNLFYEKRADSSGRPYMETFEYTRKGEIAPNQGFENASGKIDYADQIKALESRIQALERKGAEDHADE